MSGLLTWWLWLGLGISGTVLAAQRQPDARELTTRAVLAIQEDRPAEALAILGQALAQDPPKEFIWYIHYLLALAFANQENETRCMEELAQALSSGPPTNAATAILITRAGGHARWGRIEEALADVREAKRIAPCDPYVLAANGLFLFSRSGRYADAMAEYDLAVQYARKMRSEDGRKQRSYTYWKRAEANLRLERFDLAIKDCERSLREFPTVESYLGRGLVRMIYGDYELAREDAARALSLAPRDKDVQVLLGRVAFAEGDLAKAREVLEKAEKLYPVYGPLVKLSMGDTQAALNDLGKHLPRANCEPREAVQHFGLLLYVTSRPTEAHTTLMRALEETGWPCFFWPVLILAAEQVGRLPETTSLLQRRIQGFPSELWPIQLTQMVLGTKKLDELITAAQVFPKPVRLLRIGEAHYIAGEMALAKSDRVTAADCFRETVRNCPQWSLASLMAKTRLSEPIPKK